MRVLVQVFHPELSRSRINGAWAEAAREAGAEVRDLYALYPGFGIDVAREQAECEAADRIVFQHPLHWYSAPALMKKWLEDVLQFGWAYGGPDKLAGKEWLSAVSVGAAESEYAEQGTRGRTIEQFLYPYEAAARFCAMVHLPPFVQFGSGYADDAEILESARRYAGRLIART